MGRTMPTVRRRRNLPGPLRSLGTRLGHDYVDVFTVEAEALPRTPEQWARAGIEKAAGSGGQFVWRVLLGLRLAARTSPDHVAGWKIAERGEDWVRLEAASWFLTAHLIVHVKGGRVSVATFIRYDRALAALLWPAMSAGHRRAMPGLLRRAVKFAAREAV